MSTKPEFTREIRLGLVVYGGVALAVYMNGVCREFYNVVQGKGIYKILKALTNSDIVVDIISGTSAGGINGVLLSFALANAIDFRHFADIWREKGDITKLLRDPEKKDQNFESLLDGEGYYQTALESAFREAWQKRNESNDRQDWESEFRELDLFVTGTDVLGKVYSILDNTGSLIEVKDHRCVFLLKHRKDRKEPFDISKTQEKTSDRQSSEIDEAAIQALAKLCRITSCFPVAFPVVSVHLKSNDPVDNRLVEWGALEKRYLIENPEDGYQLHFIDGGVLDNRPFSYTIKEIYNRTAFKPVDRKIFYIDPNPESFENSRDFRKMVKPNLLRVLQESLISLPSYQSIGSDLQAVSELNERVRRYNLLLQKIGNVTDAIATPESEAEYCLTREMAMRDRVLPLVMQLDSNKINNAKDKEKVQKFRTAVQLLSFLGDVSSDIVQQIFDNKIKNKDVSYFLRKLFFIAKDISIIFDQERLTTDEYNILEDLGKKITRYIRVLQVIEFRLGKVLSSDTIHNAFMQLIPLDAAHLDRQAQREKGIELFTYVTDVSSGFLELKQIHQCFTILIGAGEEAGLPSSIITVFNYCLESIQMKQPVSQENRERIQELLDGETVQRLQEFLDAPYSSERSPEGSILEKIEHRVEALINRSVLQRFGIFKKFKHYRNIDRIIFPKRFLSGLPEEEEIDLIRISTYDSKMGLSKERDPKSKLSGDILYAFGGFFKKSWRSNDILWGRLDGLNRLVQGLITQESIGAFQLFAEAGYGIDNLIEESLSEENPLKDKVRQTLVDILNLLEAGKEIPESKTVELQELLVTAGHYEILLEDDLTKVITDGIEEQLAWMQIKVTNEDSAMPTFQPSTMSFNKSITAMIGKRIAEETIQNHLNTLERRIAFFEKEYTVGEEDFRSIPERFLNQVIGKIVHVVIKLLAKQLSRNGESSFPTKVITQGAIAIVSSELFIRFVRWIIKY